ncbi:hypothetical protein GJ744_001962 [Endocarpon pusillum]|uniref:Uncharacterized protein n=1 Tax=Endocarpon pusillum TaxID=364733 RepID=A0A8H7ACM2_9EURO|nr:hypothetical protein GJ744_001962 [Endocarpon pusillum]
MIFKAELKEPTIRDSIMLMLVPQAQGPLVKEGHQRGRERRVQDQLGQPSHEQPAAMSGKADSASASPSTARSISESTGQGGAAREHEVGRGLGGRRRQQAALWG